MPVDVSHYGRIERGLVGASPELAAKLAAFYREHGIRLTEMQILYPERYMRRRENPKEEEFR